MYNRVAFTVAVISVVLCVFTSVAVTQPRPGDVVPDRYIVVLKAGASPQLSGVDFLRCKRHLIHHSELCVLCVSTRPGLGNKAARR